jgi:hypothetical protein
MAHTPPAMTQAIIIVLLVVAVIAWAGCVWCIVACNRNFYPWFRPLHAAGVLPANDRGPAFVTWRRLLGDKPEQDRAAEANRLAARAWVLRSFACTAVFLLCLGLAALVKSL